MIDLVVVLLVDAGLAVILLALHAAAGILVRDRNAEEALQRMDALGGDVRLDHAREIAHIAPGSVASVVLEGLGQPDEAAAEAAMRVAAASELGRFRLHLRIIDICGTAGVLLPVGLGVWLLRPGIAALSVDGWLYLAAIGLGIALAATLSRHWLLSRLRKLALDMEKGAAVVYNTAR